MSESIRDDVISVWSDAVAIRIGSRSTEFPYFLSEESDRLDDRRVSLAPVVFTHVVEGALEGDDSIQLEQRCVDPIRGTSFFAVSHARTLAEALS